MSVGQGDWDDGARTSASTLLARAAAAARHADRRLAEAIDDFFLADDSRLDDRTRAALAATLTAMVALVENDLRQRTVAQLTGADPALIQRIASGAPVLDRLVGSGLLRDFDLMRELIARTRQDLLVDLLPALPPDEIGSASLLARLAGSADAWVAEAALTMMAAESRRRGLIDSNRLERTELPAELHHRLVWWVAAAIREQLGPSTADRMIVEAALRALADHDEGDRLESAAMRLAATIDLQPAELATVLRHALGDRRLALVIALLGHALGIDYATMRQIVLD